MATYYSNQKLIYARRETVLGNDDAFNTSAGFSPSDIVGMIPASSSAFDIKLESRINQGTDYQANNYINTDFITVGLGVSSLDKRDVMEAIVKAINDPTIEPLVVIGDDVTSEYIHPNVSAIGLSVAGQIT